MKKFNYELALKFYAENVVATLPWCSRKLVNYLISELINNKKLISALVFMH